MKHANTCLVKSQPAMKMLAALAIMATIATTAFLALPGKAYADIVAPTNYTANGSSITWSISDDGTLTVKPTSGSQGILACNGSAPWFGRGSDIKKVVGVGTIKLQGNASNLFWACSNLTSLDMTHFDMTGVTNASDVAANCSSLESVNLSGVNMSNVTDMSNMFYSCSSLKSVNLSNAKMAGNMEYMFSRCSSLESVNLSGVNMSNVTNMSNMFNGCASLKTLDLSGKIKSSEASAKNMFDGCSSLESVNLSGVNMFNNTEYMFSRCSSLESVNLSGAKMSGNMYSMFTNCSSLESVNLSGANASNVTNMSYMFSGCAALTSLDLSGFDTSNVTNMYSMFRGCSSLTSLDVSHFDTSNVTTMYGMFSDCESLTTLNLSSFDTSNVTSMGNMFYGCSKLSEIKLGEKFNFKGKNITSMPYQALLLTPPTSSTTGKWVLQDHSAAAMTPVAMRTAGTVAAGTWIWEYMPIAVFDSSNGSLKLYSDETAKTYEPTSTQTVYKINPSGYASATKVPWYSSRTSITSVEVVDTLAPESTAYWFADMTKLTTCNLSKLNTSNVTKMNYMFSNCSSLTSIDVSKFNTTKADNISYMFYNCSSLISLDVSNFDTSNATSMSSMFSGCSAIASLDVSKLDTSNATSMSSMFSGCSSLTSLDISSFDTSNATSMSGMFSGCSKLSEVKLGEKFNFKGKNITYTYNQAILPTPTSGKWTLEENQGLAMTPEEMRNSGAVTAGTWVWEPAPIAVYDRADGSLKFYGGETGKTYEPTDTQTVYEYSLNGYSWYTYVPWYPIRTSVVSAEVAETYAPTTTAYWFYGMTNMTSCDLSKLDASNVTDMKYMFDGCSSLTTLNMSGLNTSNVEYMYYMFRGCSSLATLDLSSFDTSSAANMSDMFTNCTSLAEVKLGEKFNFKGKGIAAVNNQAILPTPPSGRWVTDNQLATMTPAEMREAGTVSAGTWVWAQGPIAVLDSAEGSLKFYSEETAQTYDPTPEQTVYEFNPDGYASASNVPWNSSRTAITSVEVVDELAPASTAYWFSEMNNLAACDLSKLDTSSATIMSSMFDGCTSLAEVQLGEKFSFQGNGITDTAKQAVLPTPTADDVITGNWRLSTSGSAAVTSEELRDTYTGETMSGTWVWEKFSDRGNQPGAGDQVGEGATELTMVIKRTEQYGGTDDPNNPIDETYEVDGTKVGSNLAFTVPSALNYVVAADGTLTGPSNAYIGNASAYAVHVSGLEATAENGWHFVADADAASEANSVELHVGPAGSLVNVADYANGKAAVSGSAWEMAARYVDTTANLMLATEGEAKLVDADITTLTQFGTLRWYLTAGPAAA